jgi:hypothetical protein
VLQGSPHKPSGKSFEATPVAVTRRSWGEDSAMFRGQRPSGVGAVLSNIFHFVCLENRDHRGMRYAPIQRDLRPGLC